MPESLQHFIETAIRLALPRIPNSDLPAVELDVKVKKGMSPKKQHEVQHMASVVKEVCQSHNCKLIVDVGSGLVSLCFHFWVVTTLLINCMQSC